MRMLILGLRICPCRVGTQISGKIPCFKCPPWSGFPLDCTTPSTVRTQGTGLSLQGLFTNCSPSGETQPGSHKSPTAQILQSGTNFQTRIISHPCGRVGLHLPATGEAAASASHRLLPRASQQDERARAQSERPGPGLRARRLRAESRASAGAGPPNLTVAGSVSALASGCRARSRSLSPLPPSHPSLRLGSDSEWGVT